MAYILEKCAKALENEPHLNSDYYAGAGSFTRRSPGIYN
jgi:hypothetical protein